MADALSPWVFNVSDTDPIFNYQPYADGPFANGWQAGWSNLGVSPPDPEDNDGSGTSYHVTSFPNATVSLSFFGTSVSLLGESNCTYDIHLDGSLVSTSTPPPLGTLYSGSNLDNIVHNISLLPHPTSNDQTLNFTGAQIVTPASRIPNIERIDNQNTSVITYAGSWTTRSAHQIPNTQKPSPYFQTNVSGSFAFLNFTGRAVEVKGESNFGWWTYSVNLDGREYNMNASSVFIIPDAVLFYEDGLDENETHSLVLTNTAPDSYFFALNSVTTYHFNSSTLEAPSSPPSSTGSSVSTTHKVLSGIIAGTVVGGIAAIVGGMLLLMWIRQRPKKGISTDFSEHVIEPFDFPSSSVGTIGPTVSLMPKPVATRSSLETGDGRKRQPLPAAPTSVPISSSINPPSSSSAVNQQSEPSENESVARLADAVAQRLAMRFGSVNHNADTPPPMYSD